jgi:hypothetical protein
VTISPTSLPLPVIHKLQRPRRGLSAALATLWREQHPGVPLQLRLASETASCPRQGKGRSLNTALVLAPQGAPPWEALRKLVVDSVSTPENDHAEFPIMPSWGKTRETAIRPNRTGYLT